MSHFIKTCVIGHPINHSKSPFIHNYWIKKYELNGEYKAIDIPCENLEIGIQGLIVEGYKGFNLTIPHKELIVPLCDEVDEMARIIGAVNTVTIEDGKLRGCNTDVFGFIENIKQNYPNFNFKESSVTVLGAGGAAKAIIYGLLKEGVAEIYLFNRTLERAENLIKTTSDPKRIKAIEWEKRNEYLANIDLLINTTALGMTGQVALELDLSMLSGETLVNDIVYTPLYTNLLNQAKDRGNPIVTGIGMLIHQARPAFKSWFGYLPEVTKELQDLV